MMPNSDWNWNVLKEFAQVFELGLAIDYITVTNNLSIEVFSPVRSECFSMKRVPSIPDFIEEWHKHVARSMKQARGAQQKTDD